MPDDIEILHITDSHLLADPAGRLHGWPVAAAFQRVLEYALQRHPRAAAIILGGDLVDDESVAGYRWLNAHLIATQRTVLAIAGNHDDPERMGQYLTSATVHDELCIGGWRLIGLCSHRPGRDDGALGEAALDQLESRLIGDSTPTLICLHHPPLATGSAWIDAMGLSDAQALRARLARYPQVHGLLCGHVHQAWAGHLDGLPVWTTPSTMRQFRPYSREFAEDTEQSPGYRCLRLRANDTITTQVHRLTPATD